MKDLDYEGRRNREYQIWSVEAKAQTVKWIWESSFVNWTSEAGGLFWICGKPASGKSTLMDSIAKSTELADRLRCVPDGECTIIRHFFDFRAGKGVSNNFEGLLRSLLYQLLDNSRDHKDVNLDGVDLSESQSKQQWSIGALKEAMNTVLRQQSHPICILLDGLDEFEGDKWSLATFVRELANLSANPRVKICIASRPDPVFNFSFKDLATIKMDERNTPAIETMVHETIKDMTEPAFYDSSVAVELARRISESAKGVFLWARFAIKEVRDGLSEGMVLPELYSKLDNVPQELEEIYARILERLKPENRQKTTHMLQLVCYAQRSLTLGELYAAIAHASREQDLVVEQMSEVEIQRFEKKVLALTGGVLEIFPSPDEAHAEKESWETDSEIPSYENLETYETDLYEGQEIDGSEPHGSAKSDEAESYKIRNFEDLYVSVIHRTFHTYMDATGWSLLLNARHEGILHAHVLWLRVCTGVFPASFKGLPPGYCRSSMTIGGLLAALAGSSHANPTPTFSSRRTSGPWPALGETMESLLLEYATTYMMTHALRIEQDPRIKQDLGLRYYEMLQSSMSHSFLCYHFYYSSLEGCHCYSSLDKPFHTLHLAIGHGLVDYVKAYLSTIGDQESRELDQASSPEVPTRLPWSDVFSSGNAQTSLLEIAVRHAGKHKIYDMTGDLGYRLVAVVLEYCPRVDDAAILVALKECSTKVVQLLLSHMPSGKIALESGILSLDQQLDQDLSEREFLCPIQKPFDVRPLWCIARRRKWHRLDNAGELIDLFMARGEDINEQSGPFGTPLHGALLGVNSQFGNIHMWDLLVSKGADVNAAGHMGTPLEFVWRMLCESKLSNMRRDKIEHYQMTVGWLVRKGATNNQPDPSGMISTREQMLRFAEVSIKDLWDYLRLYKGDSVHEKSGEEEEYDGYEEYDEPDEPDDEDVEDEEGEEAED